MSDVKIEFFHQPELDSLRPFSRAVRAGNMVYVSGHSAPHDPSIGVHRGFTAAEEVKNALDYMAVLLKDAGSGLDLAVQITMLIGEKSDYPDINAEYIKHFPHGLPARHTALFGVPSDARVAFSCVALIA
ncbi:MAG: RidA family protein [Litoreibacter sp.]